MTARFWIDDVARRVVEREERLNRGLKVFRVECGIGASGIPHIGSIGDCLRSYGVKLGIENLGYKSELIAYSDDRDGLRKIPVGLPKSLERYLGMPVTDIPDPFGCHGSYGEHMSSLLIEALEKVGVEFRFISATEAYKSGLLDEQIHKILVNSEKVKKIVSEMAGLNKPPDWVPYWPVCENCGKIYTTHAYKLLPNERKVLYRCEFSFKNVKGCGFEGEASYVRGEGKLPWKGEFAARWAALGIVFEARGKDIETSFQINRRISKEVLGFEPPLSILYEMFLDKSGEKISKSKGSKLTPQQWLKYSPPELLRFLMFKRFKGTRSLSVQDIPIYMADLESNLKKYYNLESIGDKRERENIKRLIEYSYFLRKVPKPLKLHYSDVLGVVRTLPWHINEKAMVNEAYRILSECFEISDKERVLDLIRFAGKFHVEIEGVERKSIAIPQNHVPVVKEFLHRLKDELNADEINDLVFRVAREYEVKPKDLFKTLYLLIIQIPSGPKLGKLLKSLGVSKVKDIIKSKIEELERKSGV